ncbi:MAG: PQQ-binding-like beta-propeller repeat protein [Deltaproteobacteria bacterium]|nr:PQQ-binding-like beta-propeller repeat protein [Deltaproteobacteria bacterium]
MRALIVSGLVGALGVSTLSGCDTTRSQPRHPADADPQAPGAGGAQPGQIASAPPSVVGPPASAWSGGYVEPSAGMQDDAPLHRSFRTAQGLSSATEQSLTTYSVDGAGAIERKAAQAASPLPQQVLREGGGLIVGIESKEVVAVQAATGQAAWRVPLLAGDGRLFSVAAAGSAVVVVTGPIAQPVASVFARADGRSLWSAPTDGGAIAADEQRIYTLSHRGVATARAATTGALLWTVDFGLPTASSDRLGLAVGDGRLVVDVPGHGLRILDPRSGAVTLHRPKTEDAERFALRDGRLYLAARYGPSRRDPGEVVVSAVGLDTGKQLWRRAILTSRLSNASSPLWFGAKTLYGCALGRLYALDTATGRLLWQYCLGHCPELAFVTIDRQPESLLFRLYDGKLFAFAPKPSTVLPPVDLVVEGQVSIVGKPAPAGHEVMVGPATITTDARGRYRTEVSGRGTIRLQAMSPTTSAFRDGHPSMHHYQARPVQIPIEGPSPKRVDLEVGLVPDGY